MKRIALILSLIVISFSVYETYEYMSKPIIGFVTITNDSIISMKDTLVVRINFSDRNGDIGNSSRSLSKIFVTDMDYQVVQELPIIFTSVNSSSCPAEGTLKVCLDFLPILDSSTQRITTLKIYITDRSGHESNSIETPEIHLFQTEF